MDIQLQPLDSTNLQSATVLRDSVFKGLNTYEHGTLRASLNPDKYLVYKKLGIDHLEYWIAYNRESLDVVGLIGLYTESDDEKDQIWLGWYCVDPDVRGQGLGNRLLHYAVDIAKQKGYKQLKLYTTMANEYSAARRLYERVGFRDTTRSKSAKTRYYTLSIGA